MDSLKQTLQTIRGLPKVGLLIIILELNIKMSRSLIIYFTQNRAFRMIVCITGFTISFNIFKNEMEREKNFIISKVKREDLPDA